MRLFYLAIFTVFITYFAQAQSLTVLNDTVVCAGQPVTLFANVTGSISTSEYTYNSIPFAPEDYTGTNAIPSGSDDIHSASLALGFDFDFFCNTYDHVYISTNGWISFSNPPGTWDTNYGPGDGAGGTETIPSAVGNIPKNCIMGPWQDWYPNGLPSSIKYQSIGVAPNRKFVVSFINIEMFDCWATHGTFQIVLNETSNTIENHIEEKDNCLIWMDGFATQGIQNSTGTVAYTVAGRNASTWTTSNESIEWVPSIITWYVGGAIVGTGDSITITADSTTVFTAEVSLCDGTTVSDSATVTISAPYTVAIDVQNIQCNGDNDGWIDLDVTGNTNPVSYVWSTGSTTDSIYNLGSGIYTATVTEEGGCTSEVEAEITEPPVLTLDTISTINITCFDGNDGSVNLDASGGVAPYLFTFDEINWQTDSVFTDLIAGDYTFKVKDALGCEETFDLTLTQPNQIIVDAGVNVTIPYGSFTTLLGTTSAIAIASILWEPALGLSCTDCLSPQAAPAYNTTYYLTVTDALGCSNIDSVQVIVDIDYSIPNAFSPNGDGLNDIFRINTDLLSEFNIQIYDRWGTLVFASTDLSIGWDGTFNGKPQEIGTYIYSIQSTTKYTVVLNKTGTILLLR